MSRVCSCQSAGPPTRRTDTGSEPEGVFVMGPSCYPALTSVRRIHTHAHTPTRPCIHQSQATIPPPSRLHTPRHYSVSAQVSAIPLRRRVVVELWWYECALAPVDPQHRTGTRRDTGCVLRNVARAGTPSGPGGRGIPRGDTCAHADTPPIE